MLAQLMDIGKLVLGKKVPKVAVDNNETIMGPKASTPRQQSFNGPPMK